MSIAMLLVVGAALPAMAHMRLERSEPASGARLARSPAAVLLVFSKPVEASFGSIRVVGANGRAIPASKLAYASGDRHRLRISLSGTLAGTYQVRYRVLSTDGHPIRGSIGFTVRAPAAVTGRAPTGSGPRAAPVGREPAANSAVQAAAGAGNAELADPTAVSDEQDPNIARVGVGLRLGMFAAVIVLVGVTAFLLWIWPTGLKVARMAWLLGIAGTGALAATLASVILQGATAAGLRLGQALDPEVLRATLSTRYGVVATVRAGLLAVLLALLAVALRQAGRRPNDAHAAALRWPRLTAPPLLAGVLVTMSLAGHAGTGSAAPVGLTADVLHQAAVSVWLGGLAALLAGVLPRRDPVEMRQVLPRFSQVAFGAVVVVVTTGLVQTWRQVGAIDQLLVTDYGRLLLAKVMVVVLLVGAGAVSRSIVQHRLVATSGLVARAEGPGAARLDPDPATVTRLRRSVLVELAVAVAILALTAVLVATTPAEASEPTSAAPVEAAIG